MNTILGSVGDWLIAYPAWTHWIIAAGAFLQGEITIFVGVYLVVNHSLSWGDLIFPFAAGVVGSDFVLYFAGRLLRGTRFGWKFYRRRLKENRKAQAYFYYVRENTRKVLIASKFLLGANLFTVLSIGWAKTKFKKFFSAQLGGFFLWFATMTAIAYFLDSGLYYLQSAKIFQQAEYLIPIAIVVIFAGEYLFRKVFRGAAAITEQAKEIGNNVSGAEKKDEEEGLFDDSEDFKP